MLQKTYITLLFLLVASSAFAQKTERDYLRSGNKLYNDSLFIKAATPYTAHSFTAANVKMRRTMPTR